MDIKQKLIELRKDKKLTQKKVAELLGMSATGYASWEQGLAEPNLEAIRKLCNIYNVPADYILGIKDY